MSEIASERLANLLASLERMAGGDLNHRVPISARHDEVDAIGHAINVLVGELQIMAEGLRRAKEEAEAASLAKTIFLRNASHEIRTPLSVVLGMSDLIASQQLPENRIDELHQRIVSNGKALVGILDDLLDLAKVEAGKIDFDLHPISLRAMIEEILTSFEGEAERKGVQLLIEDDEAENHRAVADVKRLRQILTNVIGNAVKFTAKGRIAVRLARSSDEKQVLLDVKDTGIGMTPAQSRLLFEPFVQADATIARRFGGSGLGLALSKRFAEGMGGSLEVLESNHGSGTTFRLVLPSAHETDSIEATHDTNRLLRFGTELRGRRILVVEDNDEIRSMTTELLELAGATIVEAADGQQALDRAAETPFDAILMDVRMPNIDGLEATRRLRARDITVPIVALTADAVADQEKACIAAGCTLYLPKPIDLSKFIAFLSGGETSPPLPLTSQGS